MQPHMVTDLEQISMNSLVVQLFLDLLPHTSGLPHPVISRVQGLPSTAVLLWPLLSSVILLERTF